jgi:hypothetical protein
MAGRLITETSCSPDHPVQELPMPASPRLASFVPVVAALAIACGGESSTGPKANQLSAAEAQEVAIGVFSEISNALATSGFGNVAAVGASASALPTTTLNSACSLGGRITGTFTYSEFPSSGTGTETGTMSVTPQSCVVSTGSRNIAVSGQLTWTYSASYRNFAQSGNMIWRASGSFNWSGGSCVMDYSMTITPSGNGSLSGSVCGQSVSTSF